MPGAGRSANFEKETRRSTVQTDDGLPILIRSPSAGQNINDQLLCPDFLEDGWVNLGEYTAGHIERPPGMATKTDPPCPRVYACGLHRFEIEHI